jgi:phosphoenolpyruvate-protein kinase (PTS system EI component)
VPGPSCGEKATSGCMPDTLLRRAEPWLIFTGPCKKTTEQLETLQQRCASRLPESAALIFAAHFMILKDEKFVSRMKTLIRSGAPATQAIRDVAGHYIRLFEASPHPYIREKVSDIEDLAGRLMGNLNPSAADGDTVEHGNIVIAQELYPSEMLKLSAEGVAGIVLTNGGVTSHVAILARALKIPMVIVDAADLFRLPDETVVLVDGDMGNVYVDPSNTIIRRFETRNQARLQIRREKNAVRFGTARTADGTRVDLLANINLLSELPLAQEMGAQGVGLYRTEFPFLIRPAFPSETEQYLVYRQVVEAMGSLPVTFRTLDIGGEKTLSYTDTADEPNPELGMRSIRFSLAYRDIFENQVRAIASGSGRKRLGRHHVSTDFVSGRLLPGPCGSARLPGPACLRGRGPSRHSAHWNDGGASCRGGAHGRVCRGSRFFRDWHQRFCPIYAGRGPQQQARGRVLPPRTPVRTARPAKGGGSGIEGSKAHQRLWGDGP